MARTKLTAEERVQREIAAVAQRARAAVKTPAQWVGYRVAELAGWGVLAVGAFGLWVAYDRDSVMGMVLAALGAAWAFTAARWVAVPASERAGHHAVAAAAFAVGLWLLDLQTLAAAVAAVVVAGSGFWLVWTERARKRLHRFAWAATQLADATGDTRPLHRILAPASTESGLPARWYVPEVSARRMVRVDDDALDEGEDPGDPSTWTPANTFDPARVLSTALGTKVEIKVTRGIGVIAKADTSADAADRKKYNAVLHKRIHGRVTVLDRDDEGALQRLEFTWPASQADRADSAAYRARIIQVLQGQLGQSVSARWDLPNARAVLTPLPSLPNVIPHPPRDPDDPHHAVFGVFRGGEPCIWKLNGGPPHMLVVGTTGGGKTSLMLAILTALPETAEIYGIDPKFLSLAGIEGIPGSRGREAASEPYEMVETLEHVARIMHQRVRDVRARKVLRGDLVPIVLALDEAQTFVSFLNTYWRTARAKDQYCALHGLDKAPGGTEHPSVGLIVQILQLGREADVHMIMATQQPAAKWMGTDARDQFAVRIALGNLPEITSRMTFDSAIAASGLEAVPGRAWVSTGLGVPPRHAQIYWTPKVELGLSPADQQILLGLGVRLPDETPVDQVATPQRAAVTGRRHEAPAPASRPLAASDPDEDDEELLVQAAELILTSQFASTAMLSRKLRVGHAQAVALLDTLAEHDVVAAQEDGTFEVLLPSDALAGLLERLEDEPAVLLEQYDAGGPPAGDEDLTGEQTPVLDIADGARIVVDVDGVPTAVTVQDVAPDDVDEDYLAVSYVTDAGEAGVLSCADDEHLPVLASL